MRAIFLDMDGVLATRRSGFKIDPILVKHLLRVIKDTGAVLIVSSSWKEETLEKTMGVMPQEIRPHIKGQTPTVPGKTKGEEIAMFLEKNKYESFIIIDDETDEFSEEQRLFNLVRTDMEKGLDAVRTHEAIDLLIHPWVVTDPSCDQRRRTLQYDDGSEYEFTQKDDLTGERIRATINLDEYTDNPKFVSTYLLPYGYPGIDYLKEEFGDDWEAIAAECVFETDINEYL